MAENANIHPCTCGVTRRLMPEDVATSDGKMTHYFDGRDCVEGDDIMTRLRGRLSREDWAVVEERYNRLRP